MVSFQQFRNKFRFKPELTGFVGIEREGFVFDPHTGQMVPKANVLMDRIKEHGDGEFFGPEFSACQFEARTQPTPIDGVYHALQVSEAILYEAADQADLWVEYKELAPADMPFDYYPDPDGRYAGIKNKIKREQFEAACRVAGLHVHIGMPDHETALYVYNRVRKKVSDMCTWADHSNGQRLRLYKTMGSNWEPLELSCWHAFYTCAVEQQFVDDPRSCYWLLRISEHGTIEFRMFGSIPHISEIVPIVTRCHKECMDAIDAYNSTCV